MFKLFYLTLHQEILLFMITYNFYENNIDYTWYDSTNVVFSKCYDTKEDTKTVLIVFQNGRTYIYKDVDVNDYVAFRNNSSAGKGANTYIIKKYKGVRLSDTELSKLDELKTQFIEQETKVDESLSNLNYHLVICDRTGEFQLCLNGRPIHTDIEGQVSITRLLKSMNIKYSFETVDEMPKTEINEETIINNK